MKIAKKMTALLLLAVLAASFTTAFAPQPVGPKPTPIPDQPVSSDINPLTGLPVDNPALLALPPALISITNFPISARPQAGLSSAAMVFEMYVGEGSSRLLALFYGDYPQSSDLANGETDPSIGPIRSGRLPYESMRKLYNGFLVMASAYKTIAKNLSEYANIFGSDSQDINSAMIDITRLEAIAKTNQKELGNANLSTNQFGTAVPEGGKKAAKLWLPYSYLNQIFWHYDAATGRYLRYMDNADGVTFALQTDRLNNQPLGAENVVILFATHHVYAETVIDFDLMYQDPQPALLLRDGQMYNIFWTTRNETYEKTTGKLRPIKFVDAKGNPFPLKPGQTWVQFVPSFTPVEEVVDSQIWHHLKNRLEPGSGVWAVRFSVPAQEPMPEKLKP